MFVCDIVDYCLKPVGDGKCWPWTGVVQNSMEYSSCRKPHKHVDVGSSAMYSGNCAVKAYAYLLVTPDRELRHCFNAEPYLDGHYGKFNNNHGYVSKSKEEATSHRCR